jgi:hypothetical protein
MALAKALRKLTLIRQRYRPHGYRLVTTGGRASWELKCSVTVSSVID